MNLHSIVQSLEVGVPVEAGNLTMYPLLRAEEADASYAMLDEALAAGFVHVSEVSDAGAVPELRIVNDGPKPVLVLDGEELVGAKQNRIVNLTILVPAASTLTVPVSCVEAGRWARRSRHFSSSGRTHYAAGRAAKVAQVTRTMTSSGERYADQLAIWEDISLKSSRMGAMSDTSAAAAMYEQARTSLDDIQRMLDARPRQVGAVFAINGRVAGMEVFDCATTWQKSMRKVVESYGLDAIDLASEERAVAPAHPAPFLAAVAKARGKVFPALGLGQDVRLQTPHLAGAALAVDNHVVHALAFVVA